jgi:hypothetical protein
MATDPGDLAALLERILQRHFWASAPRAGDSTARALLDDIPILLAALRAVLEEHRPNSKVVDQWTRCYGCNDSNGGYLPYPCPTVQAIRRELSGSGGMPVGMPASKERPS